MNIRALTLALVSGVLQILIFPLQGDFSFGFLAWVCLVPLLLAIEGKTLKQAFLLGLLAGVVAYTGLLYWIIYCMHTFTSMPLAVVILVFILPVAIMAALLGLFAALYNWTTIRIPAYSLILAPCIWVALELLRTYFPLGGFPWDLLALSQYRILPIIQLADVTGIYGVSFAIVLVNAALYKGLVARARKQTAWRELALSLSVVLVLAVYGYIRIYQVDRTFSNQPELSVGVVQGNIDQKVKWDSAVFWRNHFIHVNLTEKILAEKTDLVIWPEAAITTYLQEEWDKEKASSLIRTISGFDAYLLVGSVTRSKQGDRVMVYNSSFLFSPFAKELIGRYDKIHLVPFGEYIPMKKLLFFADAIAGGATGDTDPASDIYVFETPEFKLGCVICYEVIFPDLVRRFVKHGAEFMTTMTNDSWFGKTSAPYQHHANVIFRCVENRVYFARSAQTGVSSRVDPAGRVLEKSPIYEKAAFRGNIRLSPYKTVYTRFGDWFSYAASFFALMGMLACMLQSRKSKT